jgi:membrane-bound serine protease (ClpP class)
MDVFVAIALVAIVVLLAELLLPTGGVLSGIGALGLVAAGIVALTVDADSPASDWAGPALITLGVLAIPTSYFIARKVISAHLDEPVRAGREELIGAPAVVRTSLDPSGQVWIEGALWRARLNGDWDTPRPGDRVIVDAVEGLTLLVTPESRPEVEEGAG